MKFNQRYSLIGVFVAGAMCAMEHTEESMETPACTSVVLFDGGITDGSSRSGSHDGAADPSGSSSRSTPSLTTVQENSSSVYLKKDSTTSYRDFNGLEERTPLVIDARKVLTKSMTALYKDIPVNDQANEQTNKKAFLLIQKTIAHEINLLFHDLLNKPEKGLYAMNTRLSDLNQKIDDIGETLKNKQKKSTVCMSKKKMCIGVLIISNAIISASLLALYSAGMNQ